MTWEIKVRRVLIKTAEKDDQEGFRISSENPFYEEFVYPNLEQMLEEIKDHFTLGLDRKEI